MKQIAQLADTLHFHRTVQTMCLITQTIFNLVPRDLWHL